MPSPLALSAVVMAAEIPWVLLSLHAGVVVDRLDRRWVMVWAARSESFVDRFLCGHVRAADRRVR
ncbi:MFS transporter [Lentzea sp. E54]|uniref:MFS transporter n=1 Tax=Lentzea xerophila TaxID=3435883 RepID=UPI003DA4CF72